MAELQFLLLICLIFLMTQFSSVCQETLHQDYKLIDQLKFLKNENAGHDVILKNNYKQMNVADVIDTEERSGLDSHVIGLNKSIQAKREKKSIIFHKETVDEDQENNNNNSRFVKDTKPIEPGQKYNATQKCYKIRKPICPLPFNSPSSLFVELYEKDRLFENITMEFNFQHLKKLHLMFITVMLIIIKSKQFNLKAQLSYFKMLPAFDRGSLLQNSLEKYDDIKTVLKSRGIGMKENLAMDSSIGESKKAIFHLRHQPAFLNCSQFVVYPVFNMTRLASYRPISLVASPVSFSELSEAGFYYSNRDNAIVCECCKKIIKLMSVVTSPSDAIYHKHGCQYIRDETSSEQMSERIIASSMSLGTQMLAIILDGIQDFGLTPHNINDKKLVKNQNYKKDDSSYEENKKLHPLEIHHLRSQFQNEFYVQLLNRCARLTAKIENKDRRSFGSGYAIHFPCRKFTTISIQQMPEWNEDLKKMFEDNAEVGIVYIQTTSHIFSGVSGAIKNTEVSLSLDDSKYKDMRLSGHFVLFSTKKGISEAILVCFTTDMVAVDRINELQKEFLTSANNVPEELMPEYVFIISHPHGKEKKLSFGKSSIGKYIVSNDEGEETVSEYNHETAASGILRKALLYDAFTCDGSSGAPVVAFKKAHESSEFILHVWTHNGLLIPDKDMGVTILREYSQEENISVEIRGINSEVKSNEGRRTDPPILEASDVMTGETEPRTTYQVPPSYPVFSTTLKRVESFQDWKFTHVMNPNALAEAGFFFAGYADCVRCFQCGLGLRSWKSGDDVYKEHERFRPTCPLLQSLLSERNTLSDQNAYQVETQLGMSSSLSSVRSSLDSPKLQLLLNLTMSDSLIADTTQQTSAMDIVTSSTLSRHSADDRNESSSAVFTGLDELENLSIEQSSRIQTTMESIPSQASSQVTETLLHTAIDQNGGAKNVENKLLKRENKMLHDLLRCKLCKEAPVKDLFLPCGDLYACSECSQKLTHCPACGKRILGTVTTHF